MTTPIDAINKSKIEIADRIADDLKRVAGEPLNFTLLVWGAIEPPKDTSYCFVSTLSRRQSAELMCRVVVRWEAAGFPKAN